MKVLLLNPPGRRRYVRDNYCSKVAKAGYSYSPVDLLLLSARFDDAHFIDAIADRLGPARCLARIKRLAPQAVIALVGSVSWPEDRAFLASLRQALPRTRILATGDVLLEDGPRHLAENPWLDAVILDFTNEDAPRFLDRDLAGIERMVFRDERGRVVEKNPARKNHTITGLGRPRHELFIGHRYTYPFVRRKRFATVQTDYGCPCKCRFCTMSTLGHGRRPTSEVIDELAWLAERGVRDIYFNDQTFGGDGDRLEELCQAMIEAGLGLGWCCWSRADLAHNRMWLMRKAGCHTVMLGVETASGVSLQRFAKGFDLDQVRAAFAESRREGLRTVATFIIGLPGEDAARIEDTINLALELDPDFASFNVLVPRKGSPLRTKAMAEGIISGEETILDQSGLAGVVPIGKLSAEQLVRLRNRAVRRFYLRPAYWLGRLADIRTPYDLWALISMGRSMVWR